jgi:hypothetical protein
MYTFHKAARNTSNFWDNQSMAWFILAVTQDPNQVGSAISPYYLMTERDPVIETVWVFYSQTIGISQILVTTVIVFLGLYLHSYVRRTVRELSFPCQVKLCHLTTFFNEWGRESISEYLSGHFLRTSLSFWEIIQGRKEKILPHWILKNSSLACRKIWNMSCSLPNGFVTIWP